MSDDDDFPPLTDGLVKKYLYMDSDEEDEIELEKIDYVKENYEKYQKLDEKYNFSKKAIKSLFKVIYDLLNMEDTDKSWYIKMKSYIVIVIFILLYFISIPFLAVLVHGLILRWSLMTLSNIAAIVSIVVIYYLVIKSLGL